LKNILAFWVALVFPALLGLAGPANQAAAMSASPKDISTEDAAPRPGDCVECEEMFFSWPLELDSGVKVRRTRRVYGVFEVEEDGACLVRVNAFSEERHHHTNCGWKPLVSKSKPPFTSNGERFSCRPGQGEARKGAFETRWETVIRKAPCR
jgi:hypothetical protein